jgi:transcriptional regulator with XRE-family HTH domain
VNHKHHLQNYIRTHRKRARLPQHQVAYLAGTKSGSRISRYENFSRVPDLVTVFAFEIIFGVPARELFAGIFDDARRLVEGQAANAVNADDPVFASFARMILNPAVGRPPDSAPTVA